MFCEHTISHDIDEHLIDGEPIWVKTRSNHWSGPFKWSSIQHGVDVTVWRRYSAPQPLTKDILIVHILVSPYTASNPWLTDCVSSEANSWLLNIFKLQPGGILHTYILSKRSNTYLVYRFFPIKTLQYPIIEIILAITYSCWVPSISLITIRRLNEYWWLRKTLGKNFSANIIQSHTLANVPTCLFDYCVAVDVW